MSLEIQYISKNNQVLKDKGSGDVPKDATFIWYDYNDFKDKEEVFRWLTTA